MSIPNIPGYTSPEPVSLARLWNRPTGTYPMNLWPTEILRRAIPDPTNWITVNESFHRADAHGGTRAVLMDASASEYVLKETDWAARDLGDVNVLLSPNSGPSGFSNGLTQDDGDGHHFEFFVDVNDHSGFVDPTVEMGFPFLWYWRAFPTESGWSYLDASGRNRDLVRYEISRESWRVEVAALELRTFLATAGMNLLVQLDYVKNSDGDEFDDVEDEFANDWAHCDWIASTLQRSAMPRYSRLFGQYVVLGQRTSRVPSWDWTRDESNYPEFIYGIDASSGALLRHSCDPDRLGTYFDKDSARIHYLTPINFSRDVLSRYTAEPRRYQVSAHRISCLNLWGLDMSINTAGLVEVYLGDLGKQLPNDEIAHWVRYNVSPDGKMEEGRFRRDFLGQWANSPDPVRDLKRNRAEVNEFATRLFGTPLWKPLDAQSSLEFDHLFGPTTDDPSALGGPTLVLVKAMVDGLSSAMLKAQLGGADKGEQSISLLKRWIEKIGLDPEIVEPIAALQGFRSAGGVAHLAGSRAEGTRVRLGIDGLAPWPAFIHVVEQLDSTVIAIKEKLADLDVDTQDD